MTGVHPFCVADNEIAKGVGQWCLTIHTSSGKSTNAPFSSRNLATSAWPSWAAHIRGVHFTCWTHINQLSTQNCLTHICGQVNLCSQCHYSLHYLQVSCSTGHHQRRPPSLYTHTQYYLRHFVFYTPCPEYELEGGTSGVASLSQSVCSRKPTSMDSTWTKVKGHCTV